jgi:hypothetical protein
VKKQSRLRKGLAIAKNVLVFGGAFVTLVGLAAAYGVSNGGARLPLGVALALLVGGYALLLSGIGIKLILWELE